MDDRDKFAAFALAGLLAKGAGTNLTFDELAQDAYNWADGMIDERKRWRKTEKEDTGK